MKTIIEDFKNDINSLLEVKIDMGKNVDYLDNHHDFSGVTQLYQTHRDAYEVINDIFFKLFPEELQWGCQNVITAWQNLVNADSASLIANALYKNNQHDNLSEDFARLRILADDATVRYGNLIAA